VAFEVIDSFMLYKSGVFSDPGCHDSPQVGVPGRANVFFHSCISFFCSEQKSLVFCVNSDPVA
jgi:hypothetical protein